MLLCGKVYHRVYARYQIGAEVIVAWRGELQVERNGDVGALDVLCGVAPAVLLVEEDVLLSEVHGG